MHKRNSAIALMVQLLLVSSDPRDYHRKYMPMVYLIFSNAIWLLLAIVALNIFQETIKKIIAFSIIVNIKRAHVVEILPLGRQEWVHLLSQYHYCWCPGDGRSHGMSSHGVDVVLLNISDLAPLGFINDSYRMTVGQQYNKMADDNIS